MEKIDVKGDKLELRIEGSYSAEEARQLLERIGKARHEIAKDPDTPDGVQVMSVAQPAYLITYNVQMHALLSLLIRHPLYGWIGAAFDLKEVANMSQVATQYLHAAITAATAASTDAPVTTDGHRH